MSESGRKFWGWGVEEADLSQEQKKEEAQRMEGLFDLSGLTVDPPPILKEIEIPEPKILPPDSLSEICTTNKLQRASHTYGKGFPDIVRAYERDFKIAPDIVAFPRAEQDIVDILDWCSREGVAAIPYGGGSSVVAGTEAQVGEGYKGMGP